jgi:hypothetical protein
MDEFEAVLCPYCGEPFSIELDVSGGTDQVFVYDCEICCRPIQFHVRFDESGYGSIEVTADA